MSIRPATAADEDALARICLLTGDNGTHARGLFCDDWVLADVYALPYLYAPNGFALVWEEADGVAGYVVGATDTRGFQRWFSDQWWPARRAGRESLTPGDGWLLSAAEDSARMLSRHVDDYPAHLHIDLLPATHGRGVGRAADGGRRRGVGRMGGAWGACGGQSRQHGRAGLLSPGGLHGAGARHPHCHLGNACATTGVDRGS
ncbi:MAG: GNAT family N-acetyltransferase [Demequina sp.]